MYLKKTFTSLAQLEKDIFEWLCFRLRDFNGKLWLKQEIAKIMRKSLKYFETIRDTKD